MTPFPKKRERYRVNGRFATDPSKPSRPDKTPTQARPQAPAKPLTAEDKRAIQELRGLLMRAARHLGEMMPPEQDQQSAAKAEIQPEGQAKGQASEPEKPIEPLSPLYARLLAGHEGVIDGLVLITKMMIKLILMEGAARDRIQQQPPVQPSDRAQDQDDEEQELDRRITAELDLIAARKKADEARRQSLLQP
jgi:hypothetical protein